MKRFKCCITAILVTTNMCFAMGCATGVSPEELLEQMKSGRAPFLIDVRSQGEFEKGHLPGAVHMPFYSISSDLSRLGFSRKGSLVLYCEHGPRSGLASLMLFLSGYKQVYSLDGHMKNWRSNTFPIEVITH